MLSRVADSIYWMCRYIERAENVARFIDVNLHLVLDLVMLEHEQWQPLVKVTGDQELFFERYSEATQENIIQFLTFDREYPNSILSCLSTARENARSVREAISSEMWEQVNKFYLLVREAANDRGVLDRPHAFFDEVKRNSHLFTGLTLDTMSHGEGWHFGRLGRLIERADKTSRILDVKYFILLPQVEYVGTPYDNIQWSALLKSASGLEMYRKRFHRITPAQVVEFLIFDSEFPRAIAYCLKKAEESLHNISGTMPGSYGNLAERRLGRLSVDLHFTDAQTVLYSGVHAFLDHFQLKLNEVGDAIFETFFAMRPLPSPWSNSGSSQ
jgi:uncharacterized alpha-E superfamily protein